MWGTSWSSHVQYYNMYSLSLLGRIPCFLPTEMLYRLTGTVTGRRVVEAKCGYPVLYRYDRESPNPEQSLLFFSFFTLSLLVSYLTSWGPSPSHVLANRPVFFSFFFVDLRILLVMPSPDAEHGRMRTGKDIWTMVHPPSMSVLFSSFSLSFTL